MSNWKQGYIPNNVKETQQPRRENHQPQRYATAQHYPQQPYQQAYQPAPVGGLRCSNCGGTNVQVSMVNSAMDTRNRGRGCLWSLGRTLLIVFTFGLWLIVGKSKGKAKTKIKSTKTAVCQTCGNSWTV